MAIRAKFLVHAVTKFSDGGESISARPVYGDTPENKSWSKWTPSGELQMSITNPAACGQFKPGDEVFIDIALVPKAAAVDGPAG